MTTAAATNPTDRLLVLAFGAYQAIHILVNGRYMFRESARAFPAPPNGWETQTVEWARGMAIVDWFVAVASVVFVIGYLRRRSWSVPLGLIVTAIFTAAAFMFLIGAVRIGAFAEAPGPYLFIMLTGLPGAALLVRLFRVLAHGAQPARELSVR